MEKFVIATTQVDIKKDSLQHNLDAHVRMIGEAAGAGAQLVMFPELGVTGHNSTHEVVQFAQPADGPIYHTIAEAARRHDIFVGYGFCEVFRGTHYNTYSIVGPDGLAGLQRKTHASLDEFFHFRQAYEWNLIDLGFAKIGVAICHDSEFWETWRILALMGAEVVLLPHAVRKMLNDAGDLVFDGDSYKASDEELREVQRQFYEAKPNPKLHDILARTNGVYCAFSDHVGFDGHSSHVGAAYVIDPTGKMIAHAEPSAGDALVTAELDPATYEYVRRSPWFALRKRRPEVYGELTREI